MKNIVTITGGEYRNHALEAPALDSVHPMGSREKLALFNMIMPWLENAKVLDLFAGSGALGIEALSRGAKTATFVEKNPKVAELIRRNLSRLKIENTQVISKSVENFLKSNQENFDLVFADPPYDLYKKNHGNWETNLLSQFAPLVAENGALVLSTPDVPPEIPGLEKGKTRAYARARLTIYQKI